MLTGRCEIIRIGQVAAKALGLGSDEVALAKRHLRSRLKQAGVGIPLSTAFAILLPIMPVENSPVLQQLRRLRKSGCNLRLNVAHVRLVISQPGFGCSLRLVSSCGSSVLEAALLRAVLAFSEDL